MPLLFTSGVGATGPTGPTGPSMAIPNDAADIGAPFATSSQSFVDVTGASCSVTIASGTAYIWAQACVTWSGSNETSGMRIVIGAQDGNETQDDDKGLSQTVAVNLRSTAALAVGAYTVKVQVRSVGGGEVTVEHVDLFALALPTG